MNYCGFMSEEKSKSKIGEIGVSQEIRELGFEILNNVLGYQAEHPEEARLLVYCHKLGSGISVKGQESHLDNLVNRGLFRETEEGKYEITKTGEAVAEGIEKFVKEDAIFNPKIPEYEKRTS